MVEIAKNSPVTGVYQKDIAIAQDISNKYLDHIIHALKVAGLITLVKGKKSGYVLTRLPEEISIYDIHGAFESGICVVDCISKSYVCERQSDCESYGFWRELNAQVTDYFKSISLRDIVEKRYAVEKSHA